jgi:hypothetical protein
MCYEIVRMKDDVPGPGPAKQEMPLYLEGKDVKGRQLNFC